MKYNSKITLYLFRYMHGWLYGSRHLKKCPTEKAFNIDISNINGFKRRYFQYILIWGEYMSRLDIHCHRWSHCYHWYEAKINHVCLNNFLCTIYPKKKKFFVFVPSLSKLLTPISPWYCTFIFQFFVGIQNGQYFGVDVKVKWPNWICIHLGVDGQSR